MIMNMISVMVCWFMIPSGLPINDTSKFDDFLNGRWQVETASNHLGLESVSFYEGNTVRFVFKPKEKMPTMVTKQYSYKGIDANSKKLSLSVYTKNLFSDKQQFSSEMDLVLVGQDTIKLINGKEVVLLKRSKQTAIEPV